MVIFTETGLNLLKQIVKKELQLVILNTSSEFADELSVIASKLKLLTSPDVVVHIESAGSTIKFGTTAFEDLVIEASDLFKTFGVTHIPLSEEAYNSRNMGFVYSVTLGEPVVYNETIDMYVLNDGMKVSAKAAGAKFIPLLAQYAKTYMPDYTKRLKSLDKVFTTRLNKLGLSGLVVGSSITIKAYDELKALYGETVLTLDESGNPVVIDATDDSVGMRCIKSINYALPSSRFYSGKTGTVTAMDKETGIVILDILGQTKHIKLVEDDGTELSFPDAEVIFTVEMISLN